MITILLCAMSSIVLGFSSQAVYSQENMVSVNATEEIITDIDALKLNANESMVTQNITASVFDDIYFEEFDINFRVSISQFDNILALFRTNLIQVPANQWRSEWEKIKTIETSLLSSPSQLSYAQLEYLNLTATVLNNKITAQDNQNMSNLSNQTDQIAFSILYTSLLDKRKSLQADIDNRVVKARNENLEFEKNYRELIIRLKQIRTLQEKLLQKSSNLALLLEQKYPSILTQLNILQSNYQSTLDEITYSNSISQRKIWILHHKFSMWSEYLSQVIQNDLNLLENLLFANNG